ncbi:MAG: SprB repeat-containing protein [Bacteroidia bacterium]|nr:SprB repeat-containing protein [Bacteroidia bacterium]
MNRSTQNLFSLIFLFLSIEFNLSAQSDIPCSAPFVNVEPVNCNFQTYTTTGFTYQSDAANGGVPSCASPGANQPDVWFRFIVPLSGSVCITTTEGTITDGGMSLYHGNCNTLTEVECDDDDGQNMMPMIDRSDLVPGDTMYIRFWKGWSAGSGTFSLCLVESHSDCSHYIPVCQNTTFSNHPYGPGSIQEANYYTCFTYEQQSVWLRFKFLTGGTFIFLIRPMNGIDDYDWAIFNGNNPDFCTSIDSLTAPMVCNATSTTGCDGSTGLSNAGVSNAVPPGPGNPYCPIMNVNAGDTLFILINNFSASNTGFYFTVGGTAVLDCSQSHIYSLISSFSTTDISCNGCSDGSISLNVTGGTPPYTYSWSNGATTQDISGLTAGTYSVTISDSAGIVDVASLSLLEPPNITLTPLITNLSCYGDNSGAIDLWVNCGTSPFTYLWSNQASAEDLVSIGAGNYTVTVTDANGNMGTASADVTQPPELLVNLSATNVINGNDGAIDLTVTGGIAPYTILWSTGASTEDIDSLSTGLYSVTVTDMNGCRQISSVQVDSTGLVVMPVISGSKVILFQNQPNPFSNESVISFYVPRNLEVELSLWNLFGEKISTLMHDNISTGIHRLRFRTIEEQTGTFFYRLVTPDGIFIKKMHIIK